MRILSKSNFKFILALAIGVLAVSPALSQDKPAENIQKLLEKIKEDKMLLVGVNMNFTEPEAKRFWPVYKEYQKELDSIDRRVAELIHSYATEYEANTLTEEKAEKLIENMIDVEKSESELMENFVPKLLKVLPAKKVVRYLQIESKIRSLVKYDIAGEVPLAR